MTEHAEKLLDEWVGQLLECSDCGEQGEWIEAFSEHHAPEIVEKVKDIARRKWRERNGTK